MNPRLTIEQLEQMKPHELADLLANIVLLLRRMPDVTWAELQQPPTQATAQDTTTLHTDLPDMSIEPQKQHKVYTQAELKKKNMDALKMIARELNVLYTSKVKKDELIDKILARQSGQGHSEQYQIQYI
jgi:DNA-binding response OmpR family regulator